MAGKPYLPLYVGDWKKDPAVQSLTYEERGVWMELLFFMHECPDRGKLAVEGVDLEGNDVSVPIAIPELARMLGLTPEEALCIIGKLMAKGVAGYDSETQTLYNRRMVREKDLSRKRSEAGKLGAEATWGQTDGKGIGKTDGKKDVKQIANADIDNDIGSSKGKGGEEYSQDFEIAWSLYPDRQGSNPKKAAWKSWKARLKEGVPTAHLIQAVKAYTGECYESLKSGTEFVMQARTFFGPNEQWKEYVDKSEKQKEKASKQIEDWKPIPELTDEEKAENLEIIRKTKLKMEDRHEESDNDNSGQG